MTVKNFQTMFAGPRGAIRYEVHLNWDDPWGSALANLGGIADVLTHNGAEDLIPDSAGYQPPPGGVDLDSYPAAMYEEMLNEDETDIEALAYWARVLDRYADIVPENRRY